MNPSFALAPHGRTHGRSFRSVDIGTRGALAGFSGWGRPERVFPAVPVCLLRPPTLEAFGMACLICLGNQWFLTCGTPGRVFQVGVLPPNASQAPAGRDSVCVDA